MIDTIKISHFYLKMPNYEDLESRGWRKLYDEHTGKFLSWFYKEKDGSKYPYLSLFVAPDGIVYLAVRVSLPAFIFGSNVKLPNQKEIRHGLKRLSEYVKNKSGFDFNAYTAIVWEVHFTKDYFVGEIAMRQVISKLSEMNISRFSRGGYSETTLYFHSKGRGKEENKPRTICIYDKHEDCLKKSFPKADTQKAEGMMRLEFRYKTTDAVKRFVKNFPLPNREAQNIFTQEISIAVLTPIERQILLLLEESSVQSRIVTLTQIYGKRRTGTLIQFLVNLYCFGSNFYKIKSLEFSRSAYYDCQKDCREVGIFNLFDTPKNKMQVDDVS